MAFENSFKIVFLLSFNPDFLCIRGRLKCQAEKNFALINGDLTVIVPLLKVLNRSDAQSRCADDQDILPK
ncbi:uncharacterized protein Dvar_32290 [Desulfosarcina variabilis str. Montpellier]